MTAKKRGQAAVEFLTTYGWAIMAMLVLLGALTYFDIFDSERFLTEGCDTGAQIQCLESQLETDGNLSLNLRNTYPVDVNITRIEADFFETDDLETIEETIQRGNSKVISMNVPDGELAVDTKIDVELILQFKRVGGANTYNTTGSTIVRVRN